MSNSLFPHKFIIDKRSRNAQKGHASFLVWLTGLSGSGKSTLANEIEEYLFKKGVSTYILDGDFVRNGLNKDLTFSDEDRVENIRRVGEVASLFIDAGVVVIAAFVSPFESDRKQVKHVVGKENYIEIFVDTPLETCEKRDAKGLYEKAKRGEILLPGVTSAYEAPKEADFLVTPENYQTGVLQIFNELDQKLNLK